MPVGRGQLVERQPWVQSGGLISLSFVTHLLLGLINPPAQKEVAAFLAQLAGVRRLILKKIDIVAGLGLVLHCSLPGFSSLMLILLRFISFGSGYFLFSASTAAPWFNLHIPFDFPSSIFLSS